MKVVYVILFGMVIFNAVLIATNEIGIFQYSHDASTSEETLKSYENYATDTGLFAGVFTIIGAIFGGIGAWVTKSPVPLGAGAFVGFCVGMWSNTYRTLGSLSVPNALLGIGTVAIGIVLVFATIDIMSMQGE